jgi:hypothetical protein
MTGPAPGWQPDPTGRHEYRYWDGTKWSDDVSNGGVTSTDPVAGASAPDATQAQPAAQPDPNQAQPGYQSGGFEPTATYDAGSGQGYGATGYQQAAQSGGQPGYSSGGYAPTYGAQQQPASSGPSTGLLVGLGVLVLVLIGGIAFVLLGSDDDKDDTDTAGGTTTTTTAGTDTTDPAVTTTEPPVDTTLGGGTGGDSAIVDAIAEGILQGSGGVLNQEEADCMAQAMVDEIGVDRLIELGLEADETTDPLDVLTEDEQNAVYTAMAGCVDAGTLGELGGI